jgi:hypothetical protein
MTATPLAAAPGRFLQRAKAPHGPVHQPFLQRTWITIEDRPLIRRFDRPEQHRVDTHSAARELDTRNAVSLAA